MSLFGVWSSRGLRFKIATGILCSLIPMIAIVVVTYQSSFNLSVERSGNLMVQTDKHGSSGINKLLKDRAKVFEGWVADDIFGLAIEFNTMEELRNSFEEMLELSPGFSLLTLTDKSGTVLTWALRSGSDASFDGRQLDISAKDGLEQRATAKVVPNFLVKGSGQNWPQTVMFSYPARSLSGDVNGYFVAFIDWQTVQTVVNETADEVLSFGFENAQASLVDVHSGIVLASSEREIIGTKLEADSDFWSWLSDKSRLELGLFEMTYGSSYTVNDFIHDGTNLLNKSADGLTESKLRLLLSVPQDNITGQARSVLWTSLAFAAGALLICLLMVFLLDREIARPMKRSIDGLTASTHEVGMSAERVAQSSKSLATSSSEQAASLEQTSSSLEEMASQTSLNADNTKQAALLMEEANSGVQQGSDAMDSVTTAMNRIKKSSAETEKIIKVIDEIAFQTNLLALNAAVEAARAGEAGKGFAVVAEEVRNLAQRSAEAARNTADLIEESQSNAENGARSTSELAETLANISAHIQKVTGLMNEISEANNEQARGIGELNGAMTHMDQLTQRNAANADQASVAGQELTSQTYDLRKVVYELTGIVFGTAGSYDSGIDRAGRDSRLHRNALISRESDAIAFLQTHDDGFESQLAEPFVSSKEETRSVQCE